MSRSRVLLAWGALIGLVVAWIDWNPGRTSFDGDLDREPALDSGTHKVVSSAPGQDLGSGGRGRLPDQDGEALAVGSPCLAALNRGGTFTEFVGCVSTSGEPNIALLALGFRTVWLRQGATPDAFAVLFERARDLLAPEVSVDLWAKLRRSIATSEQMQRALDRVWLYYPPRSFLELDALYGRLERVSWSEGADRAPPAELEALIIGLGSADSPEQKTYARNHLAELMESTFGPDMPEARKTAVFSAFRLIEDPVVAAEFVADRLWSATRQDVEMALFRISLELEKGRSQRPIEQFSEALVSLASRHGEVWQELKSEDSFGGRFTEDELAFLADL